MPDEQMPQMLATDANSSGDISHIGNLLKTGLNVTDRLAGMPFTRGSGGNDGMGSALLLKGGA